MKCDEAREMMPDVAAGVGEATSGMNPYVAPMRLGGSKEADARKAFLAAQAGGKFQMADPSGVWIDVTDE